MSTIFTRRRRIVLAIIWMIAIAVRFWGIDWGLPRTDLNPDELNVLQITEGITWDDLDPEFYNYSGITFHLNFLSAEAARALGYEVTPELRLYLHRLWAALWGSLTALLIYPITRDLTGRIRVALLASALFAITPLHVWDSHFAVSDIALAFWSALAMWLALRAYASPTLGRFLLGGIVVGLAIAVKFNGALAGATFIAAALLAWREDRLTFTESMRNLFAAGAISLVAFALASPYSVMNFGGTVDAFQLEMFLVRDGHYGFDLSASGWQYHLGWYQLVAVFPFAFGLPLWLTVVSGFVLFLRQATWAQIALALAYIGLYTATTFSWTFAPLRYYIPILAPMVIVAAWGLDWLLGSSRVPRAAAYGVLLVVFGYTAAFTYSTTKRFEDDTRLQAGRWGDQQLPIGAHVDMLQPIFGYAYMPRFTRADITVRQVPLDRVESLRPRMLDDRERNFVCASSITWQRNYRQGAADPDSIAKWESVRNNPNEFELVRRFEYRYLNKDFYVALDPMFDGYFVGPTIECFRLKQRRRRRPPRTPATEPQIPGQAAEQAAEPLGG